MKLKTKFLGLEAGGKPIIMHPELSTALAKLKAINFGK
jgi:hypothetical protein